MSIKEIKEIGRFLAEDDSGAQYTIIQYQEMINASSMDDPNATVRGQKYMETSDGLDVNYIDSKTFKIVNIDTVVRKI